MKLFFATLITLIGCFTNVGFAQQKKSLEGITYIERAPKTKSPKTKVVICLHGYGSNEQDLFNMANLFPASTRFIAVQSPISIGPNAFAWYAIDRSGGTTKYNSHEVMLARKQLIRFVQGIKKTYLEQEVYLMGFSQGAIMCIDMAMVYPDQFKGVMVLSGRTLVETTNDANVGTPITQLPVFIAHGRADQVLPIHYAKETQTWMREFKMNYTYMEYEMGHEISPQVLIDLKSWLQKNGFTY